jgi:hypothetical protein
VKHARSPGAAAALEREPATQAAVLDRAGYGPTDTTARRALRDLQAAGRARRNEAGLWSSTPEGSPRWTIRPTRTAAPG